MHDLVIVGGGPGGYAAALYAHNFGLSVALVEEDAVGGTCLHRGCIPAKSWLQSAAVYSQVQKAGDFGVHVDSPSFDWPSARERKTRIVDQLHRGLSGLLDKRQVDIVAGRGSLAGPSSVVVRRADGTIETLDAGAVIVATGSRPRTIPGYDIDGTRIVTSDHALDWEGRPDRVAVIGAGAIGCEFASLLTDLGAEVHLLEVLDQVLPGTDPDMARLLRRALERRGTSIRTAVQAGPPRPTESGVEVPVGDATVEVDVVLVAVGREPVTADIGLESTAVTMQGAHIEVDAETMQTSQPGVYAVGDVVAGTPALAHAGFAEAMSAVTYLATGTAAPVDHNAIPLVVYTDPEVATVGLSEAAARAAGYDVETARHGFAGVARAMITGHTEGAVKIVREKDGPILGASVVGPLAGEMIHELMYTVAWEAMPAETAAFIHAHPTIAEAIGETLLSASGRSLH